MRTYPILRLYIQNETIEFKDQEVVEATVTQEISPLSMELPASRADITIYTTSPDFNPFSSGYYYQSLKANTAADLLEYRDGDEAYIGRFYLDEWDNPSEGILTFSLQDAIGVMQNITYDGTFYENPTSLKNVIEQLAIFAPCEINVDPDVAGIELSGFLPGNTSLREAMQQACFAAGVYASTQASDRIEILPANQLHPLAIPEASASFYDTAEAIYDKPRQEIIYSDYTTQDTITDNDKLDRQELRVLPMVTGIELIAHNYVKSDVKETIFDDTLLPGDYKITFDKPYADVTVSGVGDTPELLGTEYVTEDGIKEVLITEAGGTYETATLIGKTGSLDASLTSISLHVFNEGRTIVEGYPFNDNTQAHTWHNPEATQDFNAGANYDEGSRYDDPGATYWREWTIYAPDNTWRIDKATMVNRTNSQTILDRIVAYAQARHEQTLTVLPEKEVISGWSYVVDSLYQKKLVAGAESITTDLSGGYLKEMRLVGTESTYQPLQFHPAEPT